MKRALIAVAALCVLIVGALMALPMFVSTQWVRQTVVDQISQATGLAISIDGPVSLRAFPTVALSADDVADLNALTDRIPVAGNRYNDAGMSMVGL